MQHRATASTAMNDLSSRSHTVLSLAVVQKPKEPGKQAATGRLDLVDLAGSERLSKSHSEGIRCGFW